MNMWKEPTVKIIQVFQGTYPDWFFGLGDDGKLYRWVYESGGWEKYWVEEDKPEES